MSAIGHHIRSVLDWSLEVVFDLSYNLGARFCENSQWNIKTASSSGLENKYSAILLGSKMLRAFFM